MNVKVLLCADTAQQQHAGHLRGRGRGLGPLHLHRQQRVQRGPAVRRHQGGKPRGSSSYSYYSIAFIYMPKVYEMFQ